MSCRSFVNRNFNNPALREKGYGVGKKRFRPAQLPLWLCCLVSMLLMFAAQTAFWLAAGLGYCLVPAGIFATSSFILAVIFEDDWTEGYPASLWLGVMAAGAGFTLLGLASAFTISWWLLAPAILGAFIIWGSLNQYGASMTGPCFMMMPRPPDQGWRQPIRIVDGEFRFATVVALMVQLVWKTGVLAFPVCAMCALLTFKTPATYWFLGGTVISLTLCAGVKFFEDRFGHFYYHEAFDETDLKRRGFVEVPHRGD